MLVTVVTGQDFSAFEVDLIQNGQVLANPFTGGFLTPHFSTTDFNGDGEHDLFVFDNAGNAPMLFLYENGEYVYHPEYKQNFSGIVSWALLRDFDGDGIEDIFSSAIFPAGIEIRKARREGDQIFYDLMEFPNFPSGNVLHFPFNGNLLNIFVSRVDIPSISDVDGDGDMDIITFDIGGSVIWYYRNYSVERGYGLDSLVYELEDICYGGTRESEFTEALFLSEDPDDCADGFHEEGGDQNKKVVHAGSTLTSFDFTNNGLQDLLIGDLTSETLILAINGGTSDNAWFTDQEVAYPQADEPINLSLMIGSYIVDVDHDGVQDLIASPNSAGNVENVNNIWYYKNFATNGGMEPVLMQKDFLADQTFETGRETTPTFVDVDADGLLDIVVGTSGVWTSNVSTLSKLIYLRNTGTANEPEFTVQDDDWLGFSEFANISQQPAPAFGDLDHDGDLDLLVGYSDGYLYFYENNAGPGAPMSFENPIWKYKDLEVGSQAQPLIFDVDLDGLNDIVIGENNNNSDPDTPEIRGALNFFRNVGSLDEPEFIASISDPENNPILGQVNTQTPFSTRASSAPYLVPQGDDYLMFVGSEDGNIFVYTDIKGNQDGAFTLLDDDLGQFLEGRNTTVAVADIDNDEYYEILIGNKRGGLSFYNTTHKSNLVTTDDPEKNEINVFPNPTASMVTISGLTPNSEFLIKIYDISMRLITEVQNANTIELSDYPSGLYFIVIDSDQGQCFKKIVKN